MKKLIITLLILLAIATSAHAIRPHFFKVFQGQTAIVDGESVTFGGDAVVTFDGDSTVTW